MHVILEVVRRQLVVDDALDALDVEPACGDVGRDHDRDSTFLELSERRFALALGAVTGEHVARHALVLAMPRECLDCVLAVREHDHTRLGMCTPLAKGRDQADKGVPPLRSIDHVDALDDALARRELLPAAADGHLDGIVRKEIGRDAAHLGRPRGRV